MKKALIAVSVLVFLALIGVVAWLMMANRGLELEKHEMQELAALDKQEMENEYERFTLQYSEMMTQINNDSIIEQLTQEQLRTQQLLEELRQVKSSNAREIARLKKELATVRDVLRQYIRKVDSLNQVNQALVAENTQVKDELAQQNRVNQGLQQERQSLKEQVAIAAQLDATVNSFTAMNDDKPTRKNRLKKANRLKVVFTVARNVTASNGNRAFYTVIKKPNGDVLPGGGSFSYENRTLTASARNNVEYTGEPVTVVSYWSGDEYLSAGSYLVSIFCEGNMIGSARFNMEE
jgi:myosin heavy subunit